MCPSTISLVYIHAARDFDKKIIWIQIEGDEEGWQDVYHKNARRRGERLTLLNNGKI